MYDYAHGQGDSIEGITHSICTLEFENHRPLYEWFIAKLGIYALNLTYTLMSKRHLLTLVEAGHVAGWDDPRMPTISAMRRRGFLPESIREFCDRIGVAKADSTVDLKLLEFCVREDLNRVCLRRMAVLRPLKLTITNWPAGTTDDVKLVNNPEDESAGTRTAPFTGELWIERDDFMEEPVKKWRRLAPGAEVRLRGGYFVTCTEVVKDDAGAVVELRCTYDPETRGGAAPDGRKVKGTIHWVSAATAVDAEVRLYEPLFTAEDPTDVPEGADFTHHLNPASLEVLTGCKLEPALADAPTGVPVQFERLGYFCPDRDSTPERLVFNRTISLRDGFKKKGH
jgi:glutaminyl-tRNA synthetase